MHRSFSVVAALLTAPLLSGCFVVGGGIGYLVDSGKPDYDVASRADLLVQEQGKEVLVADRDGKVHRGRYEGPRAESGEGFAVVYERWRATLPDSLRPPPLGGHVVVNGTLEGELVGFGAGAAYLKSGKRGVAANWADIEGWSDVEGTRYALPLASTQPDAALPLIASVELLVSSGTEVAISWDDIETVELKRSKHGVRNGALIGAVVDVALVIFAVAVGSTLNY
jgi:hypothetical protein